MLGGKTIGLVIVTVAAISLVVLLSSDDGSNGPEGERDSRGEDVLMDESSSGSSFDEPDRIETVLEPEPDRIETVLEPEPDRIETVLEPEPEAGDMILGETIIRNIAGITPENAMTIFSNPSEHPGTPTAFRGLVMFEDYQDSLLKYRLSNYPINDEPSTVVALRNVLDEAKCYDIKGKIVAYTADRRVPANGAPMVSLIDHKEVTCVDLMHSDIEDAFWFPGLLADLIGRNIAGVTAGNVVSVFSNPNNYPGTAIEFSGVVIYESGEDEEPLIVYAMGDYSEPFFVVTRGDVLDEESCYKISGKIVAYTDPRYRTLLEELPLIAVTDYDKISCA